LQNTAGRDGGRSGHFFGKKNLGSPGIFSVADRQLAGVADRSSTEGLLPGLNPLPSVRFSKIVEIIGAGPARQAGFRPRFVVLALSARKNPPLFPTRAVGQRKATVHQRPYYGVRPNGGTTNNPDHSAPTYRLGVSDTNNVSSNFRDDQDHRRCLLQSMEA